MTEIEGARNVAVKAVKGGGMPPNLGRRAVRGRNAHARHAWCVPAQQGEGLVVPRPAVQGTRLGMGA